MKKPNVLIFFLLVTLGCSSDDTPLEQPDQSKVPKEQVEDIDSATSDTDSDAGSGSDSDSDSNQDNSSGNDTDQSNGPDFDSNTNTVLLTQRGYSYPNGVETEVEYTERVAAPLGILIPINSETLLGPNWLYLISRTKTSLQRH